MGEVAETPDEFSEGLIGLRVQAERERIAEAVRGLASAASVPPIVVGLWQVSNHDGPKNDCVDRAGVLAIIEGTTDE